MQFLGGFLFGLGIGVCIGGIIEMHLSNKFRKKASKPHA